MKDMYFTMLLLLQHTKVSIQMMCLSTYDIVEDVPCRMMCVLHQFTDSKGRKPNNNNDPSTPWIILSISRELSPRQRRKSMCISCFKYSLRCMRQTYWMLMLLVWVPKCDVACKLKSKCRDQCAHSKTLLKHQMLQAAIFSEAQVAEAHTMSPIRSLVPWSTASTNILKEK